MEAPGATDSGGTHRVKAINQPLDLRPHVQLIPLELPAPFPPGGPAREWGEGSQPAVRESAATPGLTSVPTSVRDLMAPGSEHLQQMRESLAVVNGRRGSSEKPLPSAPLSAAVLDTRWQRLPQGGGCISEGPTEPADPELADPERPCRAEAPGWEGALYFINIDANAGERFVGEVYTKSPFLVCGASTLAAG